MKRISILLAALGMCIFPVVAQAEGDTVPEPLIPVAEQAAIPSSNVLPGVGLAQGITEITGVAISPMLGVTVVGGVTWWRSPSEHRAALPWYCQPWAWGSGLIILTLFFTKDTVGVLVPGILKKPFDYAELLENKISALVASGAFVPLVAMEMARASAAKGVEVPGAMLPLFNGGFVELVGMISLSWLYVPVAIVAFFVVWLGGHMVNVLVALSPSSILDSFLKFSRAVILSILGISYLIAPWLAVVMCLIIFAIALWLAPRALRLTIFGTNMVFDLLKSLLGIKAQTVDHPRVFTRSSSLGIPVLCGGTLSLSDDNILQFSYRRFLWGPVRTIPVNADRLILTKRIPVSVLAKVDGQKEQKLFWFLPRYRGLEEELQCHLDLDELREHIFIQGWMALKDWTMETIRYKEL